MGSDEEGCGNEESWDETAMRDSASDAEAAMSPSRISGLFTLVPEQEGLLEPTTPCDDALRLPGRLLVRILLFKNRFSPRGIDNVESMLACRCFASFSLPREIVDRRPFVFSRSTDVVVTTTSPLPSSVHVLFF